MKKFQYLILFMAGAAATTTEMPVTNVAPVTTTELSVTETDTTTVKNDPLSLSSSNTYSTQTPFPSTPPSPTPPSSTSASPNQSPTNLLSTSESPHITATTAHFECNHGGTLEDGFCICPDKWKGDTCNSPNFCGFEKINELTFPETFIGWAAYSQEECPPDTANAGLPVATARCTDGLNGVAFDALEVMECDLTLDKIISDVTSTFVEKDLVKHISGTQILTSRPEQLTASNISLATEIVTTFLSRGLNMRKSTTEATLTTVSQLLTAEPVHFTNQPKATKRLTESLEKFSVRPNNSVSLVVQPKLVIQTAQVQSSQTGGVQFRVFSGNSPDFTANRVQLKTNISEPVNNTNTSSDVQIFIKLSKQVKQNTNITVGFVVYDNDLLFQSKTFKSSLGSNKKVISGSLWPTAPEQVNLKFSPMIVSNKVMHDFACVFWDYNIDDWSTRGCFKVNSSGILQCVCNHTTNFAVLMSFKEDHIYAEPLSWMTNIGCSLSIMGLFLTILFQIMTRKSRQSAPTILLVSICVSLMIFYFLFLFGIENPNGSLKRDDRVSEENSIPSSDLHQEADRGPCTALAALMQYFLLATFTWNTLYAVHIFLLFKFTFSGPPRGFQGISIATGWGFPAVVVSVTLGVTYSVDKPLGYRREEFCWLAAQGQNGEFDYTKPMFWGFLLPVAIMLLFNIAILAYFGYSTCKTDPMLNSTNKATLKKKFMASLSLAALLGLTWILGYLVLATRDSTLNFVFSIAFCVCNTTQGLHIFILFTVRTPDFQRMILAATNAISVPHLALHKGVFNVSDSCEWSGETDTEMSIGKFSQSSKRSSE